MAAATAANPSHGLIPPRPYPVSQTGPTLRSSLGREVEIDVEYGTDNEEPVEYSPAEAVAEQMSSEWWVEGAQTEHSRPPLRRGLKADPPVNVAAGQVQWVCCPSPLVFPVAVWIQPSGSFSGYHLT